MGLIGGNTRNGRIGWIGDRAYLGYFAHISSVNDKRRPIWVLPHPRREGRPRWVIGEIVCVDSGVGSTVARFSRLAQRQPAELAVFDARPYVRVRRIDELA
jgi:hypothetical protein